MSQSEVGSITLALIAGCLNGTYHLSNKPRGKIIVDMGLKY